MSVSAVTPAASESIREEHKIKVVVWDLDNTIWDGVLLEGDDVRLRDGIVELLETLDQRGVLQSIASKNEHDLAWTRLSELGIAEYFIYPQISWNAKSVSVRAIAESINIGLDTLAFVDDQPFEREEVAHAIPEVLCIDAADIDRMAAMPEMIPHFITDDSRKRRQMYLSEAARKQVESGFEGPQEEFLASLGMRLTIAPAGEEDLKRAEELTVRTNQLNTTAQTYSYDELDAFRSSDRHRLLVAGLDDRYGTYGKIGLALIECDEDLWMIRLLLMSCRVMARGVGTIFINHIRMMARSAGVRLRAAFIANDRNRMMYLTYGFTGFRPIESEGGLTLLENDLSSIQPHPDYVEVCTRE
jgi:FkbH-like protein